VHDASQLPGFIATCDKQLAGLITYHINRSECEIVSLNSLIQGAGIGTALIDAVNQFAIESGCRRIWLITTNDNLAAFRYYQKRGFRLVAVYPGALEISRQLKPDIPVFGLDGIPLRDEIELEIKL
jgi:GNAT superfamily N-acetyltransferase